MLIVFMKEVVKPWGNEKHFAKNEKRTVKILSVDPGEELSLQKHRYRVEEWFFLTDGWVQKGNRKFKVKKGGFVKIGKNQRHRLFAKKNRVDVLEVSYGKFLQGDEVRLEDKYGRV